MTKKEYEITFGKEKYHLHREMIDWCNNYIGAGGFITADDETLWDLSIAFGNSTYYFKNERDLVIFSLRWS